jgi:Big-like domain-containing protein
VRIAAACLAVLVGSSCLPADPTGTKPPHPDDAHLLLQADLTGTAVATVVVDVAAPDIPTTLVFNIPVVQRQATGTITVPAGSQRTITLKAFDAGGVATHTGSVTLNIQPGANPTVTLVLQPLSGGVPITVTLGSFTVVVTPPRDTLLVGDTISFTATIHDANGNPVAAQVAWGTVAPALASIVTTGTQTGRVTANHPGQTTVVATYGGTAGTATVVVAGWFVSPSGSSTGDGSRRPWDLQTALNGGNGAVQPGDTIWLRGGTYAGIYTTALAGTATAPIVVRQYRGERATIDGGSSTIETLTVDGQWAIYWGFEVMQSATARFCDSCLALRPTGVYVRNAHDVQLVNLIVHDVGHGSFTENTAHNIRIYGWIVYDGGNTNKTRSDGHGLYIKNDGIGWKTIRDNVIFDQFGYGVHAFTGIGTATLRNLVIDGNVLFNNGTVSGFDNPNLQVGGFEIADNDTVTNNLLYFSPGASGFINARLGFELQVNGSIAAHDNYMVGGGAVLDMGYWQTPNVANNTLVGASTMVNVHDTSTVGWQWGGNQYWQDPSLTQWTFRGTDYTFANWKTASGLGSTDRATVGQPSVPQVFVRPNQYEPGRAHIVVYNWSGQSTVQANVSNVVALGAHYEVRNVQDVFGTPILSGTYGGGALTIPMTGVTPPTPIGGSPRAPIKTAPSFDVFLLTSSSP